MVGTWTGTIAGYEGVDAVYVDKPFKIVVQEANGQAFVGSMEWTEPDGTIADDAVRGGVTAMGQVTILDADGLFTLSVSDSKLFGTYVEQGEDAGVLAVELTRE